jgi:hypothetical protein
MFTAPPAPEYATKAASRTKSAPSGTNSKDALATSKPPKPAKADAQMPAGTYATARTEKPPRMQATRIQFSISSVRSMRRPASNATTQHANVPTPIQYTCVASAAVGRRRSITKKIAPAATPADAGQPVCRKYRPPYTNAQNPADGLARMYPVNTGSPVATVYRISSVLNSVCKNTETTVTHSSVRPYRTNTAGPSRNSPPPMDSPSTMTPGPTAPNHPSPVGRGGIGSSACTNGASPERVSAVGSMMFSMRC